ncbi:pitrilysin family protein [Nonomuraea sp. B1E8]|uniref:M16 family metallopeptidase n=1 Tax=unclassified Nonomuraea TaxID=2593643 RepID=UPI00325E166A
MTSAWTFPQPRRTWLDNGATVLSYVARGYALSAVHLILDVPREAEPPGLDGIALICARALALGACHDDQRHLLAELARLGASMSARCDDVSIRVTLEAPKEHISAALALVAPSLRAPVFPGTEIERLVHQRLEAIHRSNNDPAALAARAMNDKLFAGAGRLSRPRGGTVSTVSEISADRVRAFYASNVRPENSSIVLVGDHDPAGLPSVLTPALATWRGNGVSPAVRSPEPLRPGGPALVHIPGDHAQTHVAIAGYVPGQNAPEWPAVMVGGFCLGGTVTSRLDQQLRETNGHSFGFRARTRPLRAQGVLTVTGAVAPAAAEAALEDVVAITERIREEGLTETECEAAIRYLRGSARVQLQTTRSIAAALADQAAYSLADDHLARLHESLREVRADDASRVVANALDLSRCVRVVVGGGELPAARVREASGGASRL